jgi:hypothetical protein
LGSLGAGRWHYLDRWPRRMVDRPDGHPVVVPPNVEGLKHALTESTRNLKGTLQPEAAPATPVRPVSPGSRGFVRPIARVRGMPSGGSARLQTSSTRADGSPKVRSRTRTSNPGPPIVNYRFSHVRAASRHARRENVPRPGSPRCCDGGARWRDREAVRDSLTTGRVGCIWLHGGAPFRGGVIGRREPLRGLFFSARMVASGCKLVARRIL